eukprot:scaffold103900_cov63-Phaeocystis_antarctica.AAC.5
MTARTQSANCPPEVDAGRARGGDGGAAPASADSASATSGCASSSESLASITSASSASSSFTPLAFTLFAFAPPVASASPATPREAKARFFVRGLSEGAFASSVRLCAAASSNHAPRRASPRYCSGSTMIVPRKTRPLAAPQRATPTGWRASVGSTQLSPTWVGRARGRWRWLR